MSWFERPRVHLAHRPMASGDSPPQAEQPKQPDGGPELARETVPEDSAAPVHLPTITPGRAGRYSVTDGSGRQVGTIYGDYVIGFTVSCWGLHERYPDMDAVITAIAREARAHSETGLASAS